MSKSFIESVLELTQLDVEVYLRAHGHEPENFVLYPFAKVKDTQGLLMNKQTNDIITCESIRTWTSKNT